MRLTRNQRAALHRLARRTNTAIPLRKVTGDALVRLGLANAHPDTNYYAITNAGKAEYRALDDYTPLA